MTVKAPFDPFHDCSDFEENSRNALQTLNIVTTCIDSLDVFAFINNFVLFFSISHIRLVCLLQALSMQSFFVGGDSDDMRPRGRGFGESLEDDRYTGMFLG